MRRRISPRRSYPRWIWWAGGVLLVLAIVLVLALPALVTGWLQRYVRGSDFHQVAAQLIESRTGGRADLSPLVWHDDMATMGTASVETASGWHLEGTEIRAAVNFGAIRRGAWHIQSASADELVLTKAGAVASDPTGVFEATKVILPSWIDRHIPKATEVDGFDVERFHFTQGAWQIAAARLHLGSYNSATTSAGRFSLPGGLEGGTLKTPLSSPNQKEPLKLDIQRAAFRVTEERLSLTDSVLRWKERTSVTMHGGVRFRSGDWQAVVNVKEAPVGEFLTADWQPRLSGKLEGKVDLSGGRDLPVSWTADMALKDGVL
ncbi:MAG: hypothetical protein JNG86_11710, partial [Verrucomicrobiaceae bacterium]|nr:hypothetical protein [Verrucomicrobiaceae bacterium]